jgi:pilus assembly protein CpaC
MNAIRNKASVRKILAQAVIGVAVLFGTAAGADVPTSQPSTQPTAAKSTTNAVTVIAEGINEDGRLGMMVNKSQVITTKLPYKTLNVSNPEIADVNRVNDYEILVTAKKPGNTQLIVWDVAGVSQNVDVTVQSDLEALQAQLDKIFPGVGIQATNVNGTIALRGRVKNAAVAEQAMAVASPYSDKVLNFLEMGGGQQVMLQVRFAEVSRTASSQLGFAGGTRGSSHQFGAINGPGGSPIGAVANGDESTLNPAINIFAGGQIGGTAFEAFVQALRRNNLLRVLAEPNLIAISGESASFLAGGEFPIPVPQSGEGGNTITIEYKQFGVKLNFVPTVLGDGKIRLKVEPEVSDLDYSRSVSFQGFTIPGLTKRTVSTTIELNEGQSFAVAGLLNNRIVASKDVTPLLGDLPIVGALFRSVRYERSETELVVIVTPRVVAPMNPDQIGNLPGEQWKDPKELQVFLDQKMGSISRREKAKVGETTHRTTTATVDAELDEDAEGDTVEVETAEVNTDVIEDGGATDEESLTDADADAEAIRFRGQYGFVPATN